MPGVLWLPCAWAIDDRSTLPAPMMCLDVHEHHLQGKKKCLLLVLEEEIDIVIGRRACG